MSTPEGPALHRRLGTVDAVIIGLGSMMGAGVFVAFAPAAAAAGSGLLIGLVVAAVVAYCNATSSARLAALYPQSGGTYVYAKERLGGFWAGLAGWSFIGGKTASCAAMALTVGYYMWPGWAHAVAVAAVVALTAVNYVGIQKSALLTRALVAVVLAVLAAVVVVVLGFGDVDAARLTLGDDVSAGGVLQAAALLFFAFAGYARIATLGEEVRDPAKTIPRAIPIALGITLVVYAAVAVAVLSELGAQRLASATAPLADAVAAAGYPAFEPVVRAGAAVAALGSLLALILGVSRTTLAMARDRRLPHALAAVHPRFGSPHRADLTVGAVVAVLAAVADVRSAIGFSSFAVLLYYAIANAAAFTLGRRVIPTAGIIGCLLLASSLVGPLAYRLTT
ncbi:MAG: APC family permease [Actinomycetota bacterium]|nr:APC family permease [Actinomycetota bacterium]